ncbi:acyl-CoA dehydrogenase family protein [Pseudogemmobacter sonorensis]|uniref:acyl-CoA dehydrogenase family protein n=1 Tax=Pseudogemmobacter sonorensis TaxID=2989681 RepID=UPI0036998FEA
MNLTPDPPDAGFRAEVRAFIAENLPSDIARRIGSGFHHLKQDLVAWHRILAARGWSAPHWPVEYGGPGWTPMQQHIFAEECMAADAPLINVFGLSLVGPVIYSFGSAAQKAEYLPRILDGSDFWCQGFSEPGAGSDLAAVRTRAELDGDHWVVNGQKTWTTDGHHANRIFLLVRTSVHPRQQQGISFLLADMDAPGLTVRPIISIDGGHSVNEVFLDNVRVPAANLVGEEGKGWSYAKFLLANERTDSAQVPRSKRELRRVKELARTANGGRLAGDPAFILKVAEAEAELMALEFSVLRVLSEEKRGGEPSPITSTLKLRGSDLQQKLSDLAVEALGEYGTVYYPDPHIGEGDLRIGPDGAPGLASRSLYNRSVSIYAGSNEIHRNIIAKRILGL